MAPNNINLLRIGIDLSRKRRWQSVFPYLTPDNLELVYQHLGDASARLVLSSELALGNLSHNEPLDELLEELFTPPASHEGRTIRVLADMVVALLYPQKIISSFIKDAVREIEEAYNVALQDGGGWSSSKSNPDKRKKAVVAWFMSNQARLFYLEETYLLDSTLYKDRGGQEKRDFKARLLVKIIDKITKKALSLKEVKNHIGILKKSK